MDNIINEYKNTYYRTIEIKSIKAEDHVRTSKYKNIFAKGYTPNWYEEVFVIKEVKNTVP